MKNDTGQWVNKAEDDFRVAERELRVTDLPSYDAICFHSQQCAEKYLKACLHQRDSIPPFPGIQPATAIWSPPGRRSIAVT